MNARQQITAATYGTSLSWFFGFDDYGYPTHTKAHVSGVYRQDYRYAFDPVTGNLDSRQNYLLSKSESFTYDNLDRLKTVTGPQNLSMDYNLNGNITEKSDVGNVFGYNHPTKPYTLTGLETASGLVPEALQTVTYTSYEQPLVITESPYQATFLYDHEGQRAKMEVKQSGSTILTRWYAGSRYIKETEGATTKQYTWIGGDAYTAPCVAVKTNSGAQVYYYLLRDYLGNITHQLDMSNNVVAEYNFDAWGRRRDKDTWSYTLSGEPDLLAGRGFTSHEWLPWFNLYNMNGRLYDPVVGRFLSPDNYVQMADFTQSFNRYSYCLNNPLKYYDPTGEKWKWKWLNPFYWFDELMQWINDETEPLRDKMVAAGIPDFGVGVSVNGDGNVNVSGSYRGQEVFNTGNIDKSNASQKVNQIINDVRQANWQAWHSNSDGSNFFMGGGWHPPMALFNIDNAVKWLNNNAHESWKDANGQCAYYVRMALEAGGINTSNHPVPARLYGSYLESWGFSIENSISYFKGDIAVIQGYPGATADPVTGIPYGHIQMYNGSIWISDFKQNRPFWPGAKYEYYKPPFDIYRWKY